MGEAARSGLDDRLAAELARTGDLLEDLAVTLCLDPVVFERHAASLQCFDLLTQTIREVARVMRAGGDPLDTATGIRLDGMAARMAAQDERT